MKMMRPGFILYNDFHGKLSLPERMPVIKYKIRIIVYSWLKVILNDPVYVPPGLAELFPTISVPPTRSGVIKLQSKLTWKTEPLMPFSVGPILRVMLPPLLPERVTEGG